MKKPNLFLIVVFVLLIPASGCSASGPWRGKVIDSETKKPIEGAAVVAVWNKTIRTPAGPSTDFVDAFETITDKNGEFIIPSKKFLDIKNIREIKGPLVTIYKSGYGAFPGYQVYPIINYPSLLYVVSSNFYTPERLFEGKGVTVELPRLKTKDERLNKLINVNQPFYNHDDKKKYFIKEINNELRELGLKPYIEVK